MSAKGFTIVYALLGISLAAMAVGEISAWLIEQHDKKVEGFNKILARKVREGVREGGREGGREGEGER